MKKKRWILYALILAASGFSMVSCSAQNPPPDAGAIKSYLQADDMAFVRSRDFDRWKNGRVNGVSYLSAEMVDTSFSLTIDNVVVDSRETGTQEDRAYVTTTMSSPEFGIISRFIIYSTNNGGEWTIQSADRIEEITLIPNENALLAKRDALIEAAFSNYTLVSAGSDITDSTYKSYTYTYDIKDVHPNCIFQGRAALRLTLREDRGYVYWHPRIEWESRDVQWNLLGKWRCSINGLEYDSDFFEIEITRIDNDILFFEELKSVADGKEAPLDGTTAELTLSYAPAYYDDVFARLEFRRWMGLSWGTFRVDFFPSSIRASTGTLGAVGCSFERVEANNLVYNEGSISYKDQQYSTSLKSLDLVGLGLTSDDIEALKYMTNLVSLNLRGNRISDISVLSGLTNLTDLNLFRNQISDINMLSGLANLTNLDLAENQISDIGALSALTHLQVLNLAGNRISDISALSALTNLIDLNLYQNQISDISAVSGLVSLTNLDLTENQINDIGMLSGLTNLQALHLASNQISDISALSGLTNLVFLYLSDNQISAISALSGLTDLKDLMLEDNPISDWTPIEHLEIESGFVDYDF